MQIKESILRKKLRQWELRFLVPCNFGIEELVGLKMSFAKESGMDALIKIVRETEISSAKEILAMELTAHKPIDQPIIAKPPKAAVRREKKCQRQRHRKF